MPIHSVEDAMREMKAGSTHIKTREQAVAVGLKQERRAKRARSRSTRRGSRRS